MESFTLLPDFGGEIVAIALYSSFLLGVIFTTKAIAGISKTLTSVLPLTQALAFFLGSLALRSILVLVLLVLFPLFSVICAIVVDELIVRPSEVIVFRCDLLVRAVVKRHGIWVMIALLALATSLLFLFLFEVDILVLIKNVLLLGIEGLSGFLSLLGLFLFFSLEFLLLQSTLFFFLALALHLDLVLGLFLLAVVHKIEL